MNQLNEIAEKIAAGSDGLVFLPYMAGERSPVWNPYAKGVFYGLDFPKQRDIWSVPVWKVWLFLSAIIWKWRKVQVPGQTFSALWADLQTHFSGPRSRQILQAKDRSSGF